MQARGIMFLGFFLYFIVEIWKWGMVYHYGMKFKMVSNKKTAVILLGTILLAIGINSFLFEKVKENYLLNAIGIFLVISQLFILSKKQMLKTYLCAFMFFNVIRRSMENILFLIGVLGKNRQYYVWSDIGIDVCLILLLYFGKHLQKKYYRSIDTKKGKEKLMNIGILCTLLFMVVIHLFHGRPFHSRGMSGAILLFCIGYIVLGYMENADDVEQKEEYYEKAQNFEQLNRVQREYFQKLLKKDEETRSYRHDMKAHLLCVQNFLQKGKNQEAENYINNLLEGIQTISKKQYDIGNDMLNSILNFFFSEEVRKNCTVEIYGGIVDFGKVENVDLCTIFANICKNMIEEAERIQKEDLEKNIFLKLQLKETEHFLCFNAQNTVGRHVDFSKEQLPLRKEHLKDHGFGTENVNRVVKKYDGTYQNWMEDGKFCTFIQIPK